MSVDELHQPRRQGWAPVFLAIVTLIAYGSLAGAEFSYLDDNYNLFHNPRLNPPTLDSVLHYWTTPELGLYVPLTYTVWAVLAIVGRVSPDPFGIALNPWVFHSANIGVHLLSVLAVYALLSRLFADVKAATIGALVFALHPVQVEPVAWAAGMKDVLAGMLGIAAIGQYIAWAQSKAKHPSTDIDNAYFIVNPFALYTFATIAFILAMLAKPSALVVPFIAGVIDVGIVGRRWREVVRGLWPWVVLSVVCAVVGRWAQQTIGVPASPLWARPLIALDALAFYLYKLVFPMSLGIDYGRKPAYVMSQWWFYVTWIVPVAIGVLLVIYRKRLREFIVAGAVFVIGVGPVLGLATFLYQYRSTTADHYLYIAMLGPALAAAAIIRRYGNPAMLVGAGVVLVMLGTMTMLQGRVWQDDLKLFSHTLRVNPNSSLAMHNLGNAYTMRRQPHQAVETLKNAVKADPTYLESYESLADVLKQVGRVEEALPYRLKGIELMENRPPELQIYLTSHYVSVGRDLAQVGRTAEARELFRKALARDPADTNARKALAELDSRPATTTSTTG